MPDSFSVLLWSRQQTSQKRSHGDKKMNHSFQMVNGGSSGGLLNQDICLDSIGEIIEGQEAIEPSGFTAVALIGA